MRRHSREQRSLRRHPHRREFARAGVSCVLLVGIYYLSPVEPDLDPVARVVRSSITVVAVVLLAVLITRMVARLLRDEPASKPANLLVLLFAGVVLFAFTDYQLAVSRPGQFVRMETKTDALYFAVSTLTTVGYGDVHAAGQLARGLVIIQQLFNVAVLTTGGAVLVNRLKAGRPASASPASPAGGDRQAPDPGDR